MSLEAYIRDARQSREILLMTHIVLGYPSFDASLEAIDIMVDAGVDLIELQIPFSEPIADGPVILRANQEALAAGSTLGRCFDFAERAAARYPVPLLFMSYYNLLFRHGTSGFIERMSAAGLRGAIVPDLPPEEADTYLEACAREGVDPIFIYAPTTRDARLRLIDQCASGFIYCVARKGVTGADTEFSDALTAYLERCRRATRLPLAVGFGIKSAQDVDFLRGKADIAVVGSRTIEVMDSDGLGAVGPFIASLRKG